MTTPEPEGGGMASPEAIKKADMLKQLECAECRKKQQT